jgi:hypothetical protein
MPYSRAVSPRKAERLPAEVPHKPRGGLRQRGLPGAGPARPGSPAAPLVAGPERAESAPDGDWLVRAVPGGAASKAYRCPGCDQEIRPGVAHLVAWPAHAPGPDDRRHWHRACWEARLRRRQPARRAGR